MLTESYHASSQITAQIFQSCEQICYYWYQLQNSGGGDAMLLLFTAPGVHLAVLPLQLGEVQGDVGVRRLHADDPVPAADDGRVGDRRGHLPPELPRSDRQLPRPPPVPRRRHARTHGRLTRLRTWIDHQEKASCTLQNQQLTGLQLSPALALSLYFSADNAKKKASCFYQRSRTRTHGRQF